MSLGHSKKKLYHQCIYLQQLDTTGNALAAKCFNRSLRVPCPKTLNSLEKGVSARKHSHTVKSLGAFMYLILGLHAEVKISVDVPCKKMMRSCQLQIYI